MKAVLEGAQYACPVWKSVNRVPLAASASSVGVRVLVPDMENGPVAP